MGLIYVIFAAFGMDFSRTRRARKFVQAVLTIVVSLFVIAAITLIIATAIGHPLGNPPPPPVVGTAIRR